MKSFRLLCAGLLVIFAAAISVRAQGSGDGKPEFIRYCAACHGEDGHGGPLGPKIVDLPNPRAASDAAIRALIRAGLPAAGMPPFPSLSEANLAAITRYVLSLRAPSPRAAAGNDTVGGNAQAGYQYFMGQGRCAGCHAVRGRGGVVGPDLGNVGAARQPAEILQALRSPGSLPALASMGGRRGGRTPAANVYTAATVTLRDGRKLRGALKSETPYDVHLMGLDSRLHLLARNQVASVTREPQSLMPSVRATAEQLRDVVAYLSELRGERTGASTPLPPLDLGSGVTFAEVARPKEGTWPSYNGQIGGNRYSPLKEIHTGNLSLLAPRWMWTMPGTRRALESTPQVIDGIMYVTGANECFALDARSGRQIWHYSRPRTKDLVPTGDAATGINRGVAVLGDRVFMVTDNARLIALHRLTGQLVWDVEMADYRLNYGATQAPLAVGDLIVSGISGGDEGVRGFLSAYKASTGERVWRFWTVPAPGEPGSETWVGSSIAHPGASTWMTGTYDPEADILYWGVGNPGPDFNGDQRKGDNLYSCSVIALNPRTGKLLWHHQMTPHNTNDWDATQTPMLVDAEFRGKPRKLLLQANRNGFFYVLDRLTGEFLTGAAFIRNMTWASGLDPKSGRPILKEDPAPTYEGKRVCPTGAGATNWPSAAYHPETGQFLVFASEACAIFVKNDDPFEIGKSFYQGTQRRSAGDVAEKFLRAIDIQTGKIVWEIPNIGGGPIASGLMATAGGFVFYGDGFGAIVAADARNGKALWHFDTGQEFKGSPMAYTVDGHQRLVMIAGQTVLSFGVE